MTMTPFLPLEYFRRFMGYNPFHFWGLANASVPVTSACNTVIRQYAWQDADAAGREQIKEALRTAETRLAEYLEYFPYPRYVSSIVPWPRFGDHNQWRYTNVDADGRMVGVRLPHKHIQAIGTEELTFLDDVNVTPSDEDGDGLDDTFTATLVSAVTDPLQIVVYFTSSDRLDGAAVGSDWQIQPVSITISGGTITIKGRYWLLVKPIKYEGVAPAVLDPDTAANFVSQIAVYQRTTETEGETVDTSQAVLLWETEP